MRNKQYIYIFFRLKQLPIFEIQNRKMVKYSYETKFVQLQKSLKIAHISEIFKGKNVK